MRFDDRLLTVLNQPAGDPQGRAVRWRQLVDLVARAGSNAGSEIVGRALQAIRDEAPGVDERQRSAAARAVAALPLPIGLVQSFAADSIAVSRPVLAAADLTSVEWRELLAIADPETRRFIWTLHPGIAPPATIEKPRPEREPEPGAEVQILLLTSSVPEPLAPPVESANDTRELPVVPFAAPDEFEDSAPLEARSDGVLELETEAELEPAGPAVEPDRELAPAPAVELDRELTPELPAEDAAAPIAPAIALPSTAELLERIEQHRRTRKPFGVAIADAVESVGATSRPTMFRWECQPSGEIAWVEGVPRGALIGRSIARGDSDARDGVTAEVVRAFGMRAPFRDCLLQIAGDGIASGEWKISGVPAFDPADGRFAGYRGIAMRDVAPAAATENPNEVLADPDSLRELVHEIKTPLNAIIGFAEMIAGQYLGPADRSYRDRASEIVAQARLLLGGIDDLDFAAQLRSSSASGERRSNLDEQVEALAASLRELAAERGAEIEIAPGKEAAACRVEPELLDRLLYRLCSTVIGRAEAGERLSLATGLAGAACHFSISRPRALETASEEQLFDPNWSLDQPGGAVGFTLRLVRGLARMAAGDLVASGADIALSVPRS